MGPTPGYLVWRLSMKWRVAVDRALAPMGLTHAQYVLLASLFGMQRAGLRPSQRELADHTGLEALYVSKLARALEADGFVERARDPKDTRAMRLALTDRGREAVRPAIATVQVLLDQLLAPLGGMDDPRTAALMRDLTALLDAPLQPPGLAERESGHARDTRTRLDHPLRGLGERNSVRVPPRQSGLLAPVANVMPGVGRGRLLAPDLIGMGRSGKARHPLPLRRPCPLP